MTPPYNPGAGIDYHARLTLADIGNVPNPERSRLPQGTPGRMNGSGSPPPYGMINFDRWEGTDDGKPNQDDIEGLMEYMQVGELTVRRWFGMSLPYRNTVPTVTFKPRNSTVPPVPSALGERPISLPVITRKRVILAACLCVNGGLSRGPQYTKGDRQNDNEPYLYDFHPFTLLADAVDCVAQILDGEIDPILQMGWVQITIDPSEDGDAWDVNAYHFYPEPWEYDELTPVGELIYAEGLPK